LQTERVAVAPDVALSHFQPVERGLEHCSVQSFGRNAFEHVQYAALERFGVSALAAFDTADEHELARGIVDTAEFRRCARELGGLQKMTQR